MPTPRRHENDAARQRAYRERRKGPQTQGGPANPTSARLKALRRRAETALQTLLEEMELYRDQRSETWQEGDKGEAFQERIERVEEAIEALQEAS